MFSCTYCEKSFTLKNNLLRHLSSHKNGHKKYKCSFCEYSASRQDNLRRHNLKLHVSSESTSNISCILCNVYSCISRGEMIQHYKLEHDINIADKECLSFKSEQEFYEWKSVVEKNDKNQFIRNTGRKTSADGKLKLKFECFRSGNFKSKSAAGRRHKKFLGSNKINGYCPARIDVITFPTGEVKVEYFKTHVGHTNDLVRMRLSKDERDEVAKKISMKIPFDSILDSIRLSISSDELERRDLLTTKDLHNIARDYNLIAECIRHKNDSKGVHSWVQEMQETGNNTFIFYKAQGSISEKFPQLKQDDFVLILMNDTQREMLEQFGKKCVCMDSTQGLNSYGFELTTLLILDNLNESLPCTFMFSNRSDFEMLQIFLLNIKNSLGSNLETDIFMSDIADELFNAWVAVMGKPKFRLFCIWHVDRAWRKNLSKITSDKEKQVEVYKLLRTLMEEPDQDTFNKRFEEIVENLKSDPNTAEFGENFHKEYAQTIPSWAYCYRPLTGLNSNIDLERMHGIIKHIYLKGNKPKRLDIAVHALMRFLRDKLFDKIILFHKKKLTSKISAITQRHLSSFELDMNEVIQNDDCDNKWKVLSNDRNKNYEVVKVNNICKCDLKCDECKICIHTYVCTCPDSCIKFNMCKHIHLVRRKLITEEENSLTLLKNEIEQGILIISEEPTDSSLHTQILNDLHSSEPLPDNDQTSKKEHIMNQFLDLLNKATSEDDLELISKMLIQTQATMHTASSMRQSGSSLAYLETQVAFKK